jgi:hypothetical protein
MYLLIIATAILSFLFYSFNLKEEKLINKLVFNTQYNTSNYFKNNVFFSKTTSSHSNLEELEKLMIGICHQNQAQILICKACYQAGNTYCPYPTDSFCQQAKNVSEDDPNIVWGWLPGNLNSTHYLSELIGQPEIKPNRITSLDDFKKAGVYRFNHTITYSFYDLRLVKYTKPPDTGTDPCAFEGIVHY